ncbi:hypothetical protein GQ457_11G020090 [Hibiscus cannabinus]
METQKSQTEKQASPAAPAQVVKSCRKKKNEEATFLEDLKDHIDEFVNASMDEHKTCFKKTIQKMFGMSKIVAERSAESKEVESVLPLRTTPGHVLMVKYFTHWFLPIHNNFTDTTVIIWFSHR